MKKTVMWVAASTISASLLTWVVSSYQHKQKSSEKKKQGITIQKKERKRKVKKLQEVTEISELREKLITQNVKVEKVAEIPAPISQIDQHLEKLGLDKNKDKVEFAPNDPEILQDNIKIDESTAINVKTYSLNDSLLVQELYNFEEGKQEKIYLITHNYETEISILKEGENQKVKVSKSLLKEKIDEQFLKHSIIKHPRLIEYQSENQESLFEMMVGVPNTDSLVIVKFTVDSLGKTEVIEIENVGF